mmetsp:Transcript_56773/g.176055  ORF Transcript_56773/g.176055 Transcript_56773/m.176055 type:complete len:137 (-) Transcript_56773:551-961(-)
MGGAASGAKKAVGRAVGKTKHTTGSGSRRGTRAKQPAAARPVDDPDKGDSEEDACGAEPPVQAELTPKERMKRAKDIVKGFVQEMVRGKRMEILLPNGRRAAPSPAPARDLGRGLGAWLGRPEVEGCRGVAESSIG